MFLIFWCYDAGALHFQIVLYFILRKVVNLFLIEVLDLYIQLSIVLWVYNYMSVKLLTEI